MNDQSRQIVSLSSHYAGVAVDGHGTPQQWLETRWTAEQVQAGMDQNVVDAPQEIIRIAGEVVLVDFGAGHPVTGTILTDTDEAVARLAIREPARLRDTKPAARRNPQFLACSASG